MAARYSCPMACVDDPDSQPELESDEVANDIGMPPGLTMPWFYRRYMHNSHR